VEGEHRLHCSRQGQKKKERVSRIDFEGKASRLAQKDTGEGKERRHTIIKFIRGEEGERKPEWGKGDIGRKKRNRVSRPQKRNGKSHRLREGKAGIVAAHTEGRKKIGNLNRRLKRNFLGPRTRAERKKGNGLYLEAIE